MAVFHRLCRIAWFLTVQKTESVREIAHIKAFAPISVPGAYLEGMAGGSEGWVGKGIQGGIQYSNIAHI